MSKTSTPVHVSQLLVLCINPKCGCRADAVLGFITRTSAFLQKQAAKSPPYIIFNMYIGLLNSLPIPGKTSEQCGWGKGTLGMHLQLGFALRQLGAAPQLFRSFVRKRTALSAFPL